MAANKQDRDASDKMSRCISRLRDCQSKLPHLVRREERVVNAVKEARAFSLLLSHLQGTYFSLLPRDIIEFSLCPFLATVLVEEAMRLNAEEAERAKTAPVVMEDD